MKLSLACLIAAMIAVCAGQNQQTTMLAALFVVLGAIVLIIHCIREDIR